MLFLLTTRDRERNSAGMISLIQDIILTTLAQRDRVVKAITTTISNNRLEIHIKEAMRRLLEKRVALYIKKKSTKIMLISTNNLVQRARVMYLTPRPTTFHYPNSCKPIKIRTKLVWEIFKSRTYWHETTTVEVLPRTTRSTWHSLSTLTLHRLWSCQTSTLSEGQQQVMQPLLHLPTRTAISSWQICSRNISINSMSLIWRSSPHLITPSRWGQERAINRNLPWL